MNKFFLKRVWTSAALMGY